MCPPGSAKDGRGLSVRSAEPLGPGCSRWTAGARIGQCGREVRVPDSRAPQFSEGSCSPKRCFQPPAHSHCVCETHGVGVTLPCGSGHAWYPQDVIAPNLHSDSGVETGQHHFPLAPHPPAWLRPAAPSLGLFLHAGYGTCLSTSPHSVSPISFSWAILPRPRSLLCVQFSLPSR